MKPGWLWTIAALLTLGALFLLFFYIPGGQSEVARRGVKTEGQVIMKDSRPDGQGGTALTVTFTYRDAQNKNQMAENRLLDAGQWESLKRDQYVRVYYLPDRPGQAYIDGAAGMVPPHSSALKFLAYSMLFASLPVWFYAYYASRNPAAPKPKPSAKVTITRR